MGRLSESRIKQVKGFPRIKYANSVLWCRLDTGIGDNDARIREIDKGVELGVITPVKRG